MAVSHFYAIVAQRLQEFGLIEPPAAAMPHLTDVPGNQPQAKLRSDIDSYSHAAQLGVNQEFFDCVLRLCYNAHKVRSGSPAGMDLHNFSPLVCLLELANTIRHRPGEP